MIEFYANQSLSHEVAGDLDQYSQPTYADAVTIKGRKEHGIKLVRNTEGEETVSSATVFTETAVSVNDKIDDSLVIASHPLADLDGDTGFYEVYLK
jgi:hypothetical protein